MRLKIRNATRRSQQDIEESFNPINLDYIFDEDDPLSSWLEETEEALLDGQDNSEWLDVDENDQNDHATLVPSGSGTSSGGSGGVGLSQPSSGTRGDTASGSYGGGAGGSYGGGFAGRDVQYEGK